ncbi:MAG: formate--tetrahydrofolate ligase [Acutalibacter sp.]
MNRFGTTPTGWLSSTAAARAGRFVPCRSLRQGRRRRLELAQTICRVIEENEGKSHFAPIYPIEATVEEKITAIAQKIYGAKDVSFTAAAQKSLKDIKALGGDSMPVCIAKTQYSLSDNAKLLGRPTDFTITIRDLRLSNGAGFVVA